MNFHDVIMSALDNAVLLPVSPEAHRVFMDALMRWWERTDRRTNDNRTRYLTILFSDILTGAVYNPKTGNVVLSARGMEAYQSLKIGGLDFRAWTDVDKNLASALGIERSVINL